MGKVNHPHDAENEYQSDGEQRKKTALNESIDYRLEKKLYFIILL